MRLEIFVLGLTAFFVYNAYTDGKYTKMLLSFKKYYLGYIYELPTSEIRPSSFQTHELALKYLFAKKK